MPIELYARLNLNENAAHYSDFGKEFDISYIQNIYNLFSAADFDQLVMPMTANGPDPIIMAAYVSALPQRLGVMVEHRSGVVAPTMAARKFATLDHLLGGRLTVCMTDSQGGAAAKGEGDFLSFDERSERDAEYIQIMRNIWNSDQVIDHDGKYYRFNGAFSDVKPVQCGNIPVIWRGVPCTSAGTQAAELADIVTIPFGKISAVGDFMNQVPPRPLRRYMLEFPLSADETDQQIVDQMMTYYQRGVTIFSLHSDDPLCMMDRIGRYIVPPLRTQAAEFDAKRGID